MWCVSFSNKTSKKAFCWPTFIASLLVPTGSFAASWWKKKDSLAVEERGLVDTKYCVTLQGSSVAEIFSCRSWKPPIWFVFRWGSYGWKERGGSGNGWRWVVTKARCHSRLKFDAHPITFQCFLEGLQKLSIGCFPDGRLYLQWMYETFNVPCPVISDSYIAYCWATIYICMWHFPVVACLIEALWYSSCTSNYRKPINLLCTAAQHYSCTSNLNLQGNL